MIRAAKIELERCEGLTTEVGSVAFEAREGANVWGQASLQMCRWRRTAPESGGYHKVAFVVTYADGETYSGRYDMERHRYETLGAHMAAHLKWVSTVGRDYARKSADYAAAFLVAGYELGEDGAYNEVAS